MLTGYTHARRQLSKKQRKKALDGVGASLSLESSRSSAQLTLASPPCRPPRPPQPQQAPCRRGRAQEADRLVVCVPLSLARSDPRAPLTPLSLLIAAAAQAKRERDLADRKKQKCVSFSALRALLSELLSELTRPREQGRRRQEARGQAQEGAEGRAQGLAGRREPCSAVV